MKEIGGYFQLEQLSGEEYYPDLLPFNLGRTALLFALAHLHVTHLYIPDFICDSVTATLKQWSGTILTYQVGKDLLPTSVWNPSIAFSTSHSEEQESAERSMLKNSKWLYLINYYGQISNETLLEFSRKYGQIIVDNTHSFFQRPVPGIPTLYSIRKYFGLPDGAYLYLPNPKKRNTSATYSHQPQTCSDCMDILSEKVSITECTADIRSSKIISEKVSDFTEHMVIFPECNADYDALPQDSSSERMAHILGRYEHSASVHYQQMLDTAHGFCEEPVKRMSPLTQNLLRGIDYEKAAVQREANFRTLHTLLGNHNGKTFRMSEGPFVYPFYHSQAPALKKALAAKKIFVPTYWNNVIKECPTDSAAYDLAAHILPLPIDQRYTCEDMEYMASELLKLLNKTGDSL